MTRTLAAFLALTLVAGACAPKSRLKVGKTTGGEVVEADGVVPLQRSDLPATEASALAAAQRSAVEKVVGVYISAQTRTEKAILIENKVLAKTGGYISKYDIISKGPEGDFYRTRIRALVLMQAIAEDLRDAGLLDTAGVGNPRVSVKITEEIDGKTAGAGDGASAISQALLRRGYIVVDGADAGGSEIQITGSLSASQIKDMGEKLGGLVSYRARAALQATRAGTGQVLGSSSRDASGLDATAQLAAGKALASAGGLAAEELGGSVYSALQAGVEIAIVLRGVTKLDSLQKFQEELRSTAGNGKVVLRRFSQGSADVSVVGSSRSAAEIASHIARMKSVTAEVDTYSSSRVEATLKD